MPPTPPSSEHGTSDPTTAADARKPLTPEARRALAEAQERHRKADADKVAAPIERGGQAGPDPVRYGDWEKGGIASDF